MVNNRSLFRIEDVNLFYVFRDIFRNFWIVILAGAAAWMAVATYERVAFVPEYTSSATFVISTKEESNALSDLSLANELATVFGNIFQSDVLMTQVKKDLNKPDLECEVNCEVIEETNLLTLSVTSKSAEDSFRVINSIVDNYQSISEYLLSNAVLNVMKEANVPVSPSNSLNLSEYQKRFALLAALIVMGLIALISALRDTVQTIPGARHKVEGNLFGNICHEEKKVALEKKAENQKRILPGNTPYSIKKAALITNELVSIHFLEDFRKLGSRLEYYMKKHDYRIILISSSSENEGKSTIAANVALSLVARDKKVLVVDCDFRKPAMQKIFEVKEEEADDFGSWLDSEESEYRCAEKSGLSIAVNFTNRSKPQRLITGEKLFAYLESRREEYDYIIVDTPPMLLAADAEALTRASDAAVLVIRQDWTAIRDINDCMDFLQEGKAKLIGYILNDFETVNGWRLSKNQLRSLTELPHLPFFTRKKNTRQADPKTENE